MTFNLCPDDGPPRLWRFVKPGALGYEGGKPIVSILVKEENLQLIDKELLAQMSELEQLMVLHTGTNFITV